MLAILTIFITVVTITFCYLIQYIAEGRHILNEDIDTNDEI